MKKFLKAKIPMAQRKPLRHPKGIYQLKMSRQTSLPRL
jgi:hypothetical protein